MARRKKAKQRDSITEERSNKSWSRANIINAVTSPLGLLALVTLVLETAIGILVYRVESDKAYPLLWGMIAVLVLVLVVALVTLYKRPDMGHLSLRSADSGVAGSRHDEIREIKYDVFLSAPMASLQSDQRYQDERKQILEIIAAMKEHCNFRSVYFAGEHIGSVTQFDQADVAADEALAQLRDSKYYVMVYGDRLLSSVFIEAGYAIALSKPSVLFVRSKADLPYLLQAAQQNFRFIKVYEYRDAVDLIRIIRTNGRKIFLNNKDRNGKSVALVPKVT